MAAPLHLIIAAAQAIARDENAQKLAKSAWRAGSDALLKRAKRPAHSKNAPAKSLPALPAPAPDTPEAASKPGGWRERLSDGWSRKRRFRSGQSGDLIRFDYTDEHGLTAKRMVGNWRCEAGQLIGYCLNRREEVPFAIERIGEWQEIEVRA